MANNTFHKGSDIDLCIYYRGIQRERNEFRLNILSNVNDIFDIHIFQDLPLYIRFSVLKGKYSTIKIRRYTIFLEVQFRNLMTINEDIMII